MLCRIMEHMNNSLLKLNISRNQEATPTLLVHHLNKCQMSNLRCLTMEGIFQSI